MLGKSELKFCDDKFDPDRNFIATTDARFLETVRQTVRVAKPQERDPTRTPSPVSLAELFWDVVDPEKQQMHDAHDDDDLPSSVPENDHQKHRRCLVTRAIPPKSDEAKSPKAQTARIKEIRSHHVPGTWDIYDGEENADLMRDPGKHGVMHGRVFDIHSVKNAECEKEVQECKYRSVFQGSDIRTKTGTSAIELFEQVSNSPASFTALRGILSAAVLIGFQVSTRDAHQAYLHAKQHTATRIETWVSLPRDYWPDYWFEDGAARCKPKFCSFTLSMDSLKAVPCGRRTCTTCFRSEGGDPYSSQQRRPRHWIKGCSIRFRVVTCDISRDLN